MARFSLWGVLGLRDSNFQSGMKRAKTTTQDFSATVGRLKGVLAGAFSIGAITRYTKMISDHASRIKDLSHIYRQTTERVQEVDHAAQQSGLRFEDIASAMDQVEVKRQRAVQGNEKLIATFQRLGFSVEEIRSTETMFDMLIKKLGGTKASAKQLNAMFELLPERAGKVATTLEHHGKTGIPIVSDQEIQRIDKWSQKYENAKLALKQFATSHAGKSIFGTEATGIAVEAAFDKKNAKRMADNLTRELTAELMSGLGRGFSSAISKSSLFSKRAPRFSAVEGALMDHPKLPESPERRPRSVGSADALQRIGGFTGAAAKDVGFSIEKEQLKVQKQIERNTQPRPNSTAIF